jgi:hypothetical protein
MRDGPIVAQITTAMTKAATSGAATSLKFMFQNSAEQCRIFARLDVVAMTAGIYGLISPGSGKPAGKSWRAFASVV